MTDRAGQRGGPVPPLTLEAAIALLKEWRGEEMGWVRARIVQLARRHGEYHADQLAEVQLAQPNVIGAAVRALMSGGYIEPTGERRRNEAKAAHGRRSDVYRLTERGRTLAGRLQDEVGDRLPGPRPQEDPRQEHLFDVPDPAPPRRPGHYDPDQ